MKTDREKAGLKGSVKSVHVEQARFEERNRQLTEHVWYNHLTTFNKEGSLIEYSHQTPDGSAWRTVYEYADSGKPLASRSYDGSGTLTDEWRFIYDDQDRLVEERRTIQNSKVDMPTVSYTYDSEGRKIRIQEFDFAHASNMMIGIEGTSAAVDGEQLRRTETRYDENEETVEVKVFNADGAMVSRIELKRDALENLLEESQYLGDVVQFSPCAPDSQSAQKLEILTEEQKAEMQEEIARVFAPGKALSKQVNVYDQKGKLIESKVTMMGMETSHQTFAYNESGDKSEEIIYEGGTLRSRIIFEREYDEHGNWTKELVSTASDSDLNSVLLEPQNVIRRAITYYE